MEDFLKSKAGKKLLEQDIPKLAEGIMLLAKALNESNKLEEKKLIIEKKKILLESKTEENARMSGSGQNGSELEPEH
jgi:hypothetical protein